MEMLDAPVTAVALTCCGNYGLVGTAAGRVDRYNMQSGLHRGFYARSVPASMLTNIEHLLHTQQRDCRCHLCMPTIIVCHMVELPVQSMQRPAIITLQVWWTVLGKDSTDSLDADTSAWMCRSALQHAHDGSVTGLSADACNKLLVSGGYDGALRIWSFKRRQLLHTVPVGRPIARLCHHASSALLSVATDDLLIRMYAALPYPSWTASAA